MLYALEQLPTLKGLHVAVIGQGSIGLLFSYAAKALGARHVTGVDPIDRDGVAKEFGVDTVVRATSDRWVSHLDPHDKPDIVIEAVGHQVATLGHAIEAAAFGGTVFYFGVADDDSYPISMRTMLRNNLTLKSGVTLDRRRMLCARQRVRPRAIPSCFPHMSPTPSGSTRCRPRSSWPAGRRPSASRSRSSDDAQQAAGRARRQGADMGRMGGGARPSSAPRSSPRPGTTTSDSTSSTAISTTPTSRCCCAGSSTFPIATAVRLPSADPAPIGRVLDAGADAVIVAMVESAEQAAAAVAATRYAPAGVRSFGPLRASLGLDPAAHEAGTSVFAMIETARGLSALDEICAVPGLAGVYVGPADLAISLGHGLADAWTTSGGP